MSSDTRGARRQERSKLDGREDLKRTLDGPETEGELLLLAGRLLGEVHAREDGGLVAARMLGGLHPRKDCGSQR